MSFTIWPRFGFSESPYSQSTLAADERGSTLLVGRDQEIESLQEDIGSGGAQASVEGPIGAGKTSLINVAVFRMMTEGTSVPTGRLFVPATSTFQPLANADDMVDNLFRVLAQTLIRYRAEIHSAGLLEPETAAFEKWLTRSEYTSVSAEATIAGFGGGGSRGSEPNTSEGYTRAGFEQDVRDQLERVFGSENGGVVCILDNLEILQTVGQARQTLDELRDRIFNIPGVRWVLCGSRGIVSRARTQRLSGVIHPPTIVGPLDDGAAVEAIRRRIDLYATDGDARAPVTPDGFEFIYQALDRNLRDSLERAQSFAKYLNDQFLRTGRSLPSATDRNELLEAWLLEAAEVAFHDATGVQPRHWQFFWRLAAEGGRAGSAEHAAYGFVKQQQFTAAVTALSDANLVHRESDPDNGTRTINTITAVGWLVYFYRSNLPGQ